MQGSKHEPLKVQIDTAHFAKWLGTQPASGTYSYRSRHCATAKYLEEHGFTVLSVNYFGAQAKRGDGVIVDAKLSIGVATALSQLASEGGAPIHGQTRWGDAAKAVRAYIK